MRSAASFNRLRLGAALAGARVPRVSVPASVKAGAAVKVKPGSPLKLKDEVRACVRAAGGWVGGAAWRKGGVRTGLGRGSACVRDVGSHR